MLADARFSTAADRLERAGALDFGRSMVTSDPPSHTRLRNLVSKAFTPKALESLRPRIQQIVDGLVDQVESRGEMDLVEEFAYPLPVIVICEMLGVPVKDHERFKHWGLDIARGLDAIMLPPDSEVGKRSMIGRKALAEYFRWHGRPCGRQ